MRSWSGRAAQEARALMALRLPADCARCHLPVTTDQQWIVGHAKSRAAYPELTWDVGNWQHEHRACSDGTGVHAIQEKAARQALRGAAPVDNPVDNPVFPGMSQTRTPPTFPVSLTGVDVPERLVWVPEALGAYPWLEPLLSVPDDASVPLAMTAPHPDAVGSFGPEACQWIEASQRITLRWWQRLAIVRQLEHDAEGRLLWRVIVESAPRRAGKSVRLRGVALWRLEHGERLFGETQLVVHTGKDVAIVREIQMKAWRWAEDVAGWTVHRSNGKEALETPGGDRWLARAMHSVYGYDVALGMVDEGWGVDPEAVDDGLEPATMERPSPQLHLTSTAHRRSTSLMRRRIGDALAADDGETLLLLWAAAPGADMGDPVTWRAASPHWSQDRSRMIATKYERAMAGEVDPEADDPDPMAGFEAQYLNRWILKPVAVAAGSAVVSEGPWRALYAAVPDGQPDSVAVEGWPGQGVSVARAWRSDGVVVVSVEGCPDIASAAELAVSYRCRRAVQVGASLASDPAWRGVRVNATSGPVREAVATLARLLTEEALAHDGGGHLTGQVLALRTSPGADGLRVRSAGRADALKAAVWAAQQARKTVQPLRLITARAG